MGSAVFEVLEIQSKFKIEQNKRLTPCLHEACILVAIGVFASPASLPMCRHCDAPLRSHDQAVMEVGPLILSAEAGVNVSLRSGALQPLGHRLVHCYSSR